ncbi:hypothetical protein F5Y18DRAFT_403064 [Xylariaceae sp. FL1019]|nr:hypothetical protein F5Y18DRAFT_403064 [Xylariaceae sp. FL1019]
MDSLKEKQALFEQLETLQHCNDENDSFDAEEQALRDQSKAFFCPRKDAAAPAIVAGSQNPGVASASLSKPSDDELQIICVTPVNPKRPQLGTTFSLGSIIANTVQPVQRQSRPPSHLPLSQPHDEQSPSLAMAKRKRLSALDMAPESRQIFKDLAFFYIPNDDVNPARKLRIKKARQFGARWVRDIAEATYVIVDRALHLEDIQSILDGHPQKQTLTVVSEKYQSDCLQERRLIEAGSLYNVLPRARMEQMSVTEMPSQSSLQLKKTLVERSETQTSGHPSPMGTREESPHEAIRDSNSEFTNASGNTPHAFSDELTKCIDDVLVDPKSQDSFEKDEFDTSEHEEHRPSKKVCDSHIASDAPDEKFLCMTGGTRDTKYSGPNANVLELFDQMAHENSFYGNLDSKDFRVRAYRKAITVLRHHPKKIETVQEAKAFPGIGQQLAEHILEISETGRFRKLEEIQREPAREALHRFSEIYGVGDRTARDWVDRGYRTLDDIRSKAKLSENQQIGLDHYEDLLTRIPREEIEELGAWVMKAGKEIDQKVEIIIGGSYRRGAESSNDIDLICTKEGTTSAKDLGPFLDKLVATLLREGFLTATLASHKREEGNKWHGCCVLPEKALLESNSTHRPVWRRIDFLLVPETDIGAALIYFTGNDLFNRSIRLLAKKKGMKLNHRALSGPGIYEGRDERKIFEILGVRWREPHERWC